LLISEFEVGVSLICEEFDKLGEISFCEERDDDDNTKLAFLSIREQLPSMIVPASGVETMQLAGKRSGKARRSE
jgi:hypothetical protein